MTSLVPSPLPTRFAGRSRWWYVRILDSYDPSKGFWCPENPLARREPREAVKPDKRRSPVTMLRMCILKQCFQPVNFQSLIWAAACQSRPDAEGVYISGILGNSISGIRPISGESLYRLQGNGTQGSHGTLPDTTMFSMLSRLSQMPVGSKQVSPSPTSIPLSRLDMTTDSRTGDEEVPLLSDQRTHEHLERWTPFPWFQFSILFTFAVHDVEHPKSFRSGCKFSSSSEPFASLIISHS